MQLFIKMYVLIICCTPTVCCCATFVIAVRILHHHNNSTPYFIGKRHLFGHFEPSLPLSIWHVIRGPSFPPTCSVFCTRTYMHHHRVYTPRKLNGDLAFLSLIRDTLRPIAQPLPPKPSSHLATSHVSYNFASCLFWALLPRIWCV